MDFLHCNSCFSQPGRSKNLRFFLTDCGHSFCNECVKVASANQCRLCKATCKVIPISNELPEALKLYFTDMVKETTNLLKILVIQNKHCKIYIEEYAKKLEASYADNVKELNKMKAEYIEMKKNFQELTVQNQALKKSLIQTRQGRNTSPFGFSDLNTSKTSKTSHTSLLTPSPSSASGFSGSNLSRGWDSMYTPDTKRTSSVKKFPNFNNNLKPGETANTSREYISPFNLQSFVLSSPNLNSQPQTFNNKMNISRKPRSWSSGSSSKTTTTLRKSKDSFSKYTDSCLF